MYSWWKAAVVTVVSAVGIGFVAGSVLGDPEPLPDVGDPVVLESVEEDASTVQPSRGAAESGEGGPDREDDDQVIHPRPRGEREARREARQERREQRQEAREQRRLDRADNGGGDDDGGGGGDDDGNGDDDD